MIEHLLVYKSKTQYNLKISNIFLTNKHKFKMQQLLSRYSHSLTKSIITRYKNYSTVNQETEGYNFELLPKITL